MACDLKLLGNYGSGALGDVANPIGQISSYANVTAYTATTITIGTALAGINETFTKGTEIMIHVSASNGSSTSTTYLGKNLICKITAVSDSTLTVNGDFTAVLPTDDFANYQVQAITFAQYKNLTLSTSTIAPPAYSVTDKYGGILLTKCTDTLTFSGGNISTLDKGIPVASTAYRPLTIQEKSGTADTDKYSGWENGSTLDQFLLNAGDGAAMIIAKHYVQSATTSRIGGESAGTQFTRGNAGGATIALIAGDMTGFSTSIISKRKGSGQGLGRCYIASSTKLRNDEGLYAYDCISDPTRIINKLNIKNYGDGSFGDVTNTTKAFNNYASITSISSDGKTIGYSNKTTSGIAQIGVNSKVMFHVSKHKSTSEMSYLGKLMFANILSDDGSNLILDTAVTNVFDVDKLGSYNCQIVSVVQFNTLTLTSQHTTTTAWDDTKKIGGICAVAAKSKIDITGGGIIVENKGGGTAYSNNGLAFIGNAQMCDILPLGQGHGSVFLLTKQLNADKTSRLGAKYSGDNLGGYISSVGSGGIRGLDGNSHPGSSCQWSTGAGGRNSGTAGQAANYHGNAFGKANDGGYGSNGLTNGGGSIQYAHGCQGAHLFIIANTLNEFHLSMISTGGGTGQQSNSSQDKVNGGAGYGGFGGIPESGYASGDSGSGGYNGGGGGGESAISGKSTYPGGGGSAGWCFFYYNKIENENTSGMVAA